ncbi:Smr/MutS family protein [Capnocytophaga sp. ARDL2]|uniref:Smr/MutS family protein n=1 Tax=Capnocytophaga sp. ARDL2 TaxID=3238809 RepID=UPI0035588377
MKFEKGNKVEVLDDAFIGTVVRVKGEEVTIETADGFELSYHSSELILVEESNDITKASSISAIEEAKQTKIVKNHHRVNTEKKSKKEEYAVEIDLHIEKLVKSTKGMSKYDMLNLQVDTARMQIEYAIEKKIPKLVLIHGEGEGVLKTELEFLLGRYREVYFVEGNYRKYGFGATEVYIRQNQ